MGVRGVLTVVGLTVVLAGAAPAAAQEVVSCPNADVPVTPANATAARSVVACLVDRERASRGLPRLTVEDRVAASAQAHAQDMVDRGYFSHTAPPPAPATEGERLRAQGYEPAQHFETIGAGHTTPRQVVRGWLQSRLHCSILLRAAGPDHPSVGLTHIGVGVAGTGGGIRWVAQVALPAGGQDPGCPGFVPECPTSEVAPDDAPVKPFTAQPQNGVPGPAAPAGPPAGGGTPPPAGGAPAALAAPVLPAAVRSLRSGQTVELTVEAPTDAVLRTTVVDFRGERRALGAAHRVAGVAASGPGLAVFALPRLKVTSALDVEVTDGHTTVTRHLVPGARLTSVRARSTARGVVRVTGRLQPGLRGRRIEVGIRRGKHTTRRVIRTSAGGRFSVTLRAPRGQGLVRAVLAAPGDGGVYHRATSTARAR